jgi:hypothetical protein
VLLLIRERSTKRDTRIILQIFEWPAPAMVRYRMGKKSPLKEDSVAMGRASCMCKELLCFAGSGMSHDTAFGRYASKDGA